jgi:hypothetical protein
MLEAGGKPDKREEYSLELLELIASRKLGEEKTWSFQKFAHSILQIGKADIDPKVKGVWKMQFRPIDEVVRDIYIRDAREYGKEEGKIEVARKLLTRGVSPEIIAESADLSLDKVKSLMN